MVLISLAASTSARAQETTGASLTFRGAVDVSLVLVPVLVRKGSRWVDDLERKDFRLFIDERPVSIEVFERGIRSPVSLVFLQDLSGSMDNGGKLDSSRKALRYFLNRAEPADEWALATFAGGQMQLDVPFTSESGLIFQAMYPWKGYGTTGLHDAVAWLPEIGAEGRRHKRGVLLITDGVDNASQIDPREAREMVRAAKLPVYVLGLQPNPQAATSAEEGTFRYAQLLQLLASATGGRYHSIRDQTQVRGACEAIQDDLENQYVLGFSANASGLQRYRRIRVEAKGRKLSVTHREGYSGGRPVVPNSEP